MWLLLKPAANPAAAAAGKNVTIYMLDSGIKASHQEFQPWGAAGAAGSGRALSGPDFVDDDDDAGVALRLMLYDVISKLCPSACIPVGDT
jgi:subtilisin family serine protease